MEGRGEAERGGGSRRDEARRGGAVQRKRYTKGGWGVGGASQVEDWKRKNMSKNGAG